MERDEGGAPARCRLALFSRRRLAAVGDGDCKFAPRLSSERRDLSSWCRCTEPLLKRRPEDPRWGGVRLLAASPEGADGVEVEVVVVVVVAVMAWAWMLEVKCRRGAASRGEYDTRSGPFCTAGSLIEVVVVAVAGATSTFPVGVNDRELLLERRGTSKAGEASSAAGG